MKLFNRIFTWYFKKKALPYWCIFLLDILIVYFTAFFVYWMMYRGAHTQHHFYVITNVMAIYLAICAVFYKIYRTYLGIIRYSSFVDLRRVAFANIWALVVSLAVHYLIFMTPEATFEHLSGRHLVLTCIIATAIQWGVRMIAKIIYDLVSNKDLAVNTFIYGIQDGGVALAKTIRSQRPLKYNLKGFISPEPKESNFILMGCKVYNGIPDVIKAVERNQVEAVLVSPTRKTEFRNDQQLQDMLIALGVKIYMVEQNEHDSLEDLSNSEEVQLKEVEVEDLLPRDEITVDLESVAQELAGKRILITGAAGSIGSEIVRQVASYSPAKLILIDQAETPEHDIRLMMRREWPDLHTETIVTSICNPIRMERIFAEEKPDYVFHAAAYKHVPMMEDNPGEAVHNNVYGTKVIADLSVKYGVKKFVMISTDKAVNPTNVMGCSKRICEIYVQSLNNALTTPKVQSSNLKVQSKTEFITTRFGNVLGSNGSVIPLFKEQIRNGGPVTVTDPNIIRFFMLIPEACKLVLEAGTKGHGGEIFVFDMGQPVRIADLAKRMIQLSGAKNVEIKYTGLRAGEKLYEEVLNDQENTKPTFNEKIRIASVRQYDFKEVSREIDELIQIGHDYDDMAIVRKMKEIVPEFRSNNSKYQVLDI